MPEARLHSSAQCTATTQTHTHTWVLWAIVCNAPPARPLCCTQRYMLWAKAAHFSIYLIWGLGLLPTLVARKPIFTYVDLVAEVIIYRLMEQVRQSWKRLNIELSMVHVRSSLSKDPAPVSSPCRPRSGRYIDIPIHLLTNACACARTCTFTDARTRMDAHKYTCARTHTSYPFCTALHARSASVRPSCKASCMHS